MCGHIAIISAWNIHQCLHFIDLPVLYLIRHIKSIHFKFVFIVVIGMEGKSKLGLFFKSRLC